MVKTRLVYLLPLLVLTGYVYSSEPATIYGTAPSYANTELTFYRTSDWITGSEDTVGTCLTDSSGNFRLQVYLGTTTQLYTYVGIYLGYFFAEPGKSYELILPERRDKLPEDELNPYFEPVEIHFGLANFSSDDLNMLIVMFDDAYIPYYDKHVNSIYFTPDFAQIDKDISQIESSFLNYKNEYFRNYRQYHYGMLKMLANRQRVQSISDEYFNNHPVLYNNTAYADLFNQVYNKYFTFFSRSDSGRKVFDDINVKGSYRALWQTLSETKNFSNDTLTELVLLKQIHDEFYGSQFSRNGLLRILDTLMTETNIAEHRRIASNIRYKITRLQAGYQPPEFELQDANGKLVKLSDFKGRYVYLNFCTCQSYACLNEFNMLSALNQRHKDKLTIITISTDPQEEVLRQFLAKNKYDWVFLSFENQPGIIKEYDVRAFPTYFLIGPDGKLIFSPSASPSENFEQKLFEVMRSRGDL